LNKKVFNNHAQKYESYSTYTSTVEVVKIEGVKLVVKKSELATVKAD